MNDWKMLSGIRREYGQSSLDELNLSDCPIALFKLWFKDVLNTEKNDPTAMVLSTVDHQGRPDSRVVLLKEINNHNAFVFFTNYQSVKSLQIQDNPYVALNFYWPSLVRQVRIRGCIHKISEKESDEYFSSRPIASQCSAIVSPQSSEITSRTQLEKDLNHLLGKAQKTPLVRPAHWGGYGVVPDEVEFWQGRDSRLHDRIQYYRFEDQWKHRRLAP